MLLYIIFYSFIYYINNIIHYNSKNSVFIHIHTYFYNAIHVERQVQLYNIKVEAMRGPMRLASRNTPITYITILREATYRSHYIYQYISIIIYN